MNRRAFLLGASSLVAAASMPTPVHEVTTTNVGTSWVGKSADEILSDIRGLLVGVAEHDARAGEVCTVRMDFGSYRMLAGKDLRMGQDVRHVDIMHHVETAINMAKSPDRLRHVVSQTPFSFCGVASKERHGVHHVAYTVGAHHPLSGQRADFMVVDDPFVIRS